MKKTLVIMLMLFVAFSAFAAGASEVSTLKVGMVTDQGTIDDRSFNQGTYEGLKRAALELGLEYTYLKPNDKTTGDYMNAISDLYDQGFRFVACPGFLFEAAVAEAQVAYPDLKLLIIDAIPTGGAAENTSAVLFKEEQSGFLAGLASALQVKDGSAGFVGGIAVPAVQRYNWGFQQGIAYANENYGTTIEMDKSNFIYSGSFSDLALGGQLASAMYDKGVNVLFACAGGTGVGAINETKTRRLAGENVWAVGVDVDQYSLGDLGNGESCILTSAMKYIDVAAYNAVKAANDGTFVGGQVSNLGAETESVGIPTVNPNLDDDVLAKVKQAEDAIKSGKLVVQNTADGLIE